MAPTPKEIADRIRRMFAPDSPIAGLIIDFDNFRSIAGEWEIEAEEILAIAMSLPIAVANLPVGKPESCFECMLSSGYANGDPISIHFAFNYAGESLVHRVTISVNATDQTVELVVIVRTWDNPECKDDGQRVEILRTADTDLINAFLDETEFDNFEEN
jgi:hypothetical protein